MIELRFKPNSVWAKTHALHDVILSFPRGCVGEAEFQKTSSPGEDEGLEKGQEQVGYGRECSRCKDVESSGN